MSYIFDIGDVTVWSPSLRVGKLYVRMAQDVAHVLETTTGITAMASDFSEIEIEQFNSFIHVMRERCVSGEYSVFEVLIGAVLAPSIIMLERGGRSIVPRSDEERKFFGRAHELSMSQ